MSKLATIFSMILISGFSTTAMADLDDLETPQEAPPPVSAGRETKTKESVSSETPPVENTESKDEVSNPSESTQKADLKTGTSKNQQERSLKMNPEDPEAAKREPIKLKSKGLKAQKDGAIVELSEEVQILQGDLKMKSDYAKVFFDKTTNEVSKAEAQGHVVVQRESVEFSERMTASADKATFLNSERKIVFTGNASVNRNGSLLKGKKIFYDMKTGWITFEGAEGIMQPGQENRDGVKK